ncbi:MAG TPA: S8 family serine peptidase [Candidatus Limnocylindrales bacterium]|nr:S8 family serine peptidase [Candidatus Limnocylindrales bacterium]
MNRLMAFALSLTLTATTVVVASAATGWQAKVDDAVLRAATLGRSVDVIVYMREKADLSTAERLPTKKSKGIEAYRVLTRTAASSQAPVLELLRARAAQHRSFWIANAIHVRGIKLDLLQALAQRADVRNLFAVGKGRLDEPVERGSSTALAPDASSATSVVGPSIGHVQADKAWALGYRGQGVVVAGADTGVRWTHRAIKNQYRGFNPTTGSVSHDYSWRNAAGPPTCANGDAQPCDDDDHGTHTIGTIVGDDGAGNQIGVAPDAEWIACKNMNNGVGVVPTYMDCMQWFIAPTDINGNNPDPSKAPDVVNNSWGCIEACAPPLLKDMTDASRAAGIVYVVSAGNDNQFLLGLTTACSTVVWPLAVYRSAYSVGATNATNDNIASFSSLGPVVTNPIEGVAYRKPDIVAPGVGIRSATAASDTSYAALSGTSMAGPHVAGLVALIISANPALRGHVSTIEDIISQTAKPLTTTKGCGGDSSTDVPNNVFGWGRIDALAAVRLAAMTDPPSDPGEPAVEGELLDPAHNAPIPCEAIHTLGSLPRSARNLAHVANLCGFVGTDLEFQSRIDANGDVHDYVFLGTMGAGLRIFDVTDPHLPRYVGGYLDPGWQNDVQVFGNLAILGFDPVSVAIHGSDCLRQQGSGTTGQTRGGVDFIHLDFDPALAALKAPLTFQTKRKGCYLTAEGGGAHTITIHPSGEWLAVNTSTTGIEVVDLRNDAFTFVRKIPAAIAASAHDVFFSRDGNTMYVAGIGSTRIVDVSDVFNRAPTLIANVPNSPSAAQGADGHVVAISHQSDTTADGRVMIVTDEKGGGLSQTSCHTSTNATTIGGAHFWALQELSEVSKSNGASVGSPRKIGTWVYPNPGLAVDPLTDVLAGLGRTERACTIHVYRAGGNGGQSPAVVGQGSDGRDGVSRLPVNQVVSAHYGAGVWHIDVMAAPGPLDDPRTTWGRTLGWNVMPGAETWSAKEYKGYVYAGDMGRGLDIFRFTQCEGVDCLDVLAPTPGPTPTPSPEPTPTVAPTATPEPTPTATPTAQPTPAPARCVTFRDTLEPAPHPDWTTGTAENDLSVLSPTWAHSLDPFAKSPTHSWANDARTLGLKDTRLIAPTQRITRTTQLSFWHRYFFEDGYDGGVLEVSTDNGRSWVDVTTAGSFVTGGYDGAISEGFGSPIAGRNAWTGGDVTARVDAMSQVVVSLGGFVPAGRDNATVMIRWRWAGDSLAVGAFPGDEWWIDDVELSHVAATCP